MAINYTNDRKINQHFPLAPPKFTQIGIFGLKINHLATLMWWSSRLANLSFRSTIYICMQVEICTCPLDFETKLKQGLQTIVLVNEKNVSSGKNCGQKRPFY
jgi:hypothetical protein